MADPILIAKREKSECFLLTELDSAVGREIIRGVLGSILGGSSRRR